MRILVVILLVFHVKQSINQIINHCPDFFQYIEENNSTSGEITITRIRKNDWISLNVSIGSNGNIYFDNGKLMLSRNNEGALPGNNIKYILLLPNGEEIPRIKFITLNGNTICNGSQEFFSNNWSFEHNVFYGEETIRSLYTSNSEQIYPKFSDWLYAQSKNEKLRNTQSTDIVPPMVEMRVADDGQWLENLPLTCGHGRSRTERQLGTVPLILNGERVFKREYPWLVYLEYQQPSTICGGTLITDRHIVTAAHCTQDFTVIAVHLGKHDRYTLEEGSVRVIPKQIIAHPEYKKSEPNADIALIIIDPVQLNSQITPACIWPFGLNFDDYFPKATVAGWGVFMNDEPSSRFPMKTDVPIISLEMCRKSNVIFKNIATEHTICAGGQDSGPCYGDSGSGMYFQHNSTWYLRGVVSTSIKNLNNNYCQTGYYAVYVDIVFYLNWLHQYINYFENSNVSISNRISVNNDYALIEIDSNNL